MIFKKSPVATAQLDSPDTIIGKGVYLKAAHMRGRESIRIEGRFEGTLEVDGSLVLGESGRIDGNVDANYFLVAGEVRGNIHCSTQLHFASTARVNGDITANSLIVDEGSQVSGRYLVGQDRMSGESLQAGDELLRLQASEDFDS